MVATMATNPLFVVSTATKQAFMCLLLAVFSAIEAILSLLRLSARKRAVSPLWPLFDTPAKLSKNIHSLYL